MGLLDFFKKKKKEETTIDTGKLAEDVLTYADWAKNNLNTTGYNVDYTLESMKEVERFFVEQSQDGGALTNSPGSILFGIGSLIGETIIKTYGGKWVTDDNDPQGEINVSVELPDGTVLWPVQRCIKRLQNGPEENIYDYVYVLSVRR